MSIYASKVWVRRPNSSPTRILIPSTSTTPIFSPTGEITTREVATTPSTRNFDVELTEEFLVDDLREEILKRYPQSLGKHHDAADLSIRIPLRRQDSSTTNPSTVPSATADSTEIVPGRLLSPDENVIKILKEEYPDGQKSTEAWTIITSGGKDNYTRWWLQTGGFSTDGHFRGGGFSPNQWVPSTGGSFGGSEALQQEYFPYVPQTVVTPPGEFPTRSRASGSSLLTHYSRSQPGRPPLRPARTTTQEGGLFPPQMGPGGRRYDATNSSSLIVEPVSGAESEIGSVQQGRASPDAGGPNALRYAASIRPNSSISGRATPPNEYANRMRQIMVKGQPPGPSATGFQMQLPPQGHSVVPKPASPLGGPPTHAQQRLSHSNGTRPVIPNPVSSSNVALALDSNKIPAQQQVKGQSSPKSPESRESSNGSNPTGLTVSTSPVTRRKSNTLSNQPVPVVAKPRSPSPGAEHPDTPIPTRLPLVKKEETSVPAPVPSKASGALGNIPPINVLIVEDNFINAQILEAFFRKRKLKYATAVNGKEAVEKWRQGGWHLVLMDIQLPVMSGIEATKEIRRLERVNHIGVFSTNQPDEQPSPEDSLGDLPFPSPVIIVALTASSRESDRNEALAAGCNDFLTKPVGAPWLERKAIEWGCMQALIWTSFERKRRRAENGDTETPKEGTKTVELPVGAQGEAEGAEKPPVARGDSEDSVKSNQSAKSMSSIGSTDEGPA